MFSDVHTFVHACVSPSVCEPNTS